MKKVFIQRLSISLLLVMLAGCLEKEVSEEVPLPFYNQADFTPKWIAPDSEEFAQIHKIENFEFINQNGELISNKTMSGSIYVTDFFFTICPGICPKMTANMEIIHNQFKGESDIKLLSHSVMPWVDSVSVLKEYAVNKGIDSDRWHFVTGDKDEIYDLARNSYFAEKEIGMVRNSHDFLHTENFILVDQNGRIRGVYNGTLELEMKRLIRDIKTLKALG